jgi:predicted acetyltransferase
MGKQSDFLDKEPFKVKAFRSLPGNIKRQVANLSYECFMAERTERQRLEAKDKFFSKPCVRFLAMRKSCVIGEISVFRKTVDYDRERILIGGIGDVGVMKEARRKGVATVLLKRAMQKLKQQKCDVALLCTDVTYPGLVNLYAQVGFVKLVKHYTFLGKSGKRYKDYGGMIASVNSKIKFKHLLKSKKILDMGIGDW